MSFQPPPDPALARWRRVEEICDAALRLDPSERDAYLADVCGADEALRREVEALLVHEETSQGFLSAPVGAIAARLLEPPRDLIGTRIADYDIVAKLGEGGMGEVYRARDRKLGRDVAIKVLPAAVANDQERLKRFEREARLLASVNHPAIGAIYGLVDAGDLRALVLELIEGETLAARLERGSLKLDRALALAAQICDALEHAHRRGVTHRDLKPSNVMLSDGGVKVLDFGVGKWASPATGAAVTRESTLTNEGAIVGTLHYMAPEQLEGRATDARSDIFSFGAVLYEMLSGRRAFDGPSQASIIAAVLEAPTPRLTGIGGALAPRLERVVAKCLAKRPEDRWQSAGDLGDELRWLGLETVDGPGAAPSPSSKPPRHTAIAVGLAALVAVFLVGWAWNWGAKSTGGLAAPISFFERTQDSPLDQGTFDISNDGGQLLYGNSTRGSLFTVRRLGRFDTFGLPGSGTTISPVFSPDGEWVAFLTGDAPRMLTKMRVGAEGSPVIVLNDAGPALELAWPTADTIFIAGPEQPIRSVSANGGQPKDVTTIQADTEIDHHRPVLLPSGNGLLFSVHGKRNDFSIAVQDLRSGERRPLIESGFAPAYSSTGHLLFGRGAAVLAVPFDERGLTREGDEVTIVDGVSTAPSEGQAHYRLSKNGTLVYRPRPSIDGRLLMWVDRAGRETPVGVPPRSFDNPSVSPDGKQLAFTSGPGDRRDIWTWSLDGGPLSRLTDDGNNWSPFWTLDGDGIIYARRDLSNESKVVLRRLDGTPLETLAADLRDLEPQAMTPDGKHLLLSVRPPTDEFYLAQASRGSSKLQTFLQTTGLPRQARLSPDGQWLAYTESVFNTEFKSNRTEVIVRRYPEPGVRHQVTVDGGNHPLWSRDGKELFYQFGGRIFAVTIDATRGLKWGHPRMLFERRFLLNFQYSYDVAPDGRFLMVSPAPDEGGNNRLKVVVNWHNELTARAPARR